MQHLIALAASIVLNAAALGALHYDVYAAQTPRGEVYVTQLDVSQAPPTYARAESRSASVAL